MIARSPQLFAIFLIASAALHAGSMTLVWSEEDAEMEGGAQVAQSSLGSSFADLTEGVQEPVRQTQTVTKPMKPEAVEQVVAAAAPQTPVSTQQPTTPASQPTVVAQKPIAAAQQPVAPAPTPTVAAEAPKVETAKQIYQDPQTVSQPLQTETVVAALPQTSAATEVSVRPQAPLKRPEPPAVKKSAPAPKPVKQTGNATRNAKAGAVSGRDATPSQPVQSSKVATRKAQGNAAASNYPGQVMRRLSRVPRPRTSARGVAVISFSIAANGGLSKVSVARSSGSGALDQAALAVVRKAGPFPPPPAGARRSYSINIKGR